MAIRETSNICFNTRSRTQALRLEERIRQLEADKEGVLNSATEASRPLLKQIESMAAATAAAAEAAERAEAALAEQLRGAEARLTEARDAERAALSRLAVAGGQAVRAPVNAPLLLLHMPVQAAGASFIGSVFV